MSLYLYTGRFWKGLEMAPLRLNALQSSAKRKFLFIDRFSALADNSVGVIPRSLYGPKRTPVSLPAASPAGRGVKTTEHVIENVPFQYARPVLSG